MRPILAYYDRGGGGDQLYLLPDRIWRTWDGRDYVGDRGECPIPYLASVYADLTAINRAETVAEDFSCLVTNLNWMLRSVVDR